MRLGTKLCSSKYGREVSVQHRIQVTNNHLHVVHLIATCGSTRHSHKVTIGAMDGKRPHPPTTAELQAMIDKYRQVVADEAAWKESIRESIGGIE